MNRLLKFSLTAFLIALLSACASGYPLNMSEEQWKSLTPDERKALLLKQQQYDEEQRLARIKANARERELQLQKEIAEKQRLQKLYDNPVNGNVLMVNILGGDYVRGKSVKQIMPETYNIALGEIKPIELPLQDASSRYSQTETFYLQYNLNGNAVYLYLDHPQSYGSQRIALLRDGKWQCGSRYKTSLDTSYKKLHKVKFFIKESGSQCLRNPRQKHYY